MIPSDEIFKDSQGTLITVPQSDLFFHEFKFVEIPEDSNPKPLQVM